MSSLAFYHDLINAQRHPVILRLLPLVILCAYYVILETSITSAFVNITVM